MGRLVGLIKETPAISRVELAKRLDERETSPRDDR